MSQDLTQRRDGTTGIFFARFLFSKKNQKMNNLSPDKKYTVIIICPQTTAPSGKKGKLVTLGSRKELDCLVQFINDQFDEPAFEVKDDKKTWKSLSTNQP